MLRIRFSVPCTGRHFPLNAEKDGENLVPVIESGFLCKSALRKVNLFHDSSHLHHRMAFGLLEGETRMRRIRGYKGHPQLKCAVKEAIFDEDCYARGRTSSVPFSTKFAFLR